MSQRVSFVKILAFVCLFLCLSCLFSPLLLAQTEAERAYQKAEERLRRFAVSKKVKYRRHWEHIISQFKRIYLRYPESPVAPKALYRTGRLYEELYGYSGRKSDLRKALKYYQIIWEKYPSSPEAPRALRRAAWIYERKFRDPVKALALRKKISTLSASEEPKASSPPETTLTEALPGKAPSPQPQGVSHKQSILKVPIGGTIKQIRYWSSEDYSRVVLDLTGKVKYKANVLQAMKGKPPRLYIDCQPAKISPYLKPSIPIKDGLLQRIRVGQYQARVVRVVLDLASLTDYKVFFLNEPPRLVIDLIGKEKKAPKPKSCPVVKTPVTPKVPPKGKISLAQQLGLCIRRVVIDPGHGGKDSGCRNGRLREKNIVLDVSKRVAQKLKKRLGCEVILTRKRDYFIPLEQRTAFANIKRADLFVSIHVNSSPQRRAQGIETYYLNFASDKEAMRVAALENAASTRSLAELQDLLKKILLNSKLEESKRLAEKVQLSLVRTLRRRYKRVRNRGVKTAPFVVLIGTRMPAILVEIGFISNPTEYRRLQSNRYLDLVAEGIVKGIEEYVKNIKIAKYY